MRQRRSDQSQRGFSLVFTMLIIVLLTLLVAGAIAFTGSEQSAAVLRSRAERQSACLQAARNEFLSRIRVLASNVEDITFDQTVPMPGGETLRLRTGHRAGSTVLTSVERLPDTAAPSGNRGQDLTNRSGRGGSLRAAYYRVTATCQDQANGPEQEVEFGIRVGI